MQRTARGGRPAEQHRIPAQQDGGVAQGPQQAEAQGDQGDAALQAMEAGLQQAQAPEGAKAGGEEARREVLQTEVDGEGIGQAEQEQQSTGDQAQGGAGRQGTHRRRIRRPLG